MTETDTAQPGVRRLFFALWPNEALQARLYRLGGELLGDGRGRQLRQENLHITLAFLGNVDAGRLVCLEREAAIQAPSFTLTIDRAGYWPRSGILWAAGTPPVELIELVGGLNRALTACGFQPETRPFHAHVTLARNARLRGRLREQPVQPLEWRVNEFALVESEMLPEGARYKLLRTWALKAGTRDEARGAKEDGGEVRETRGEG